MIEIVLLVGIGYISGNILALCALTILYEIKDAVIDYFDEGVDIGVCKC